MWCNYPHCRRMFSTGRPLFFRLTGSIARNPRSMAVKRGASLLNSQVMPHELHRCGYRIHIPLTGLSTGPFVGSHLRVLHGCRSWKTSEAARQCWRTRTASRPLKEVIGGTAMQSMGRVAAAEEQLELLSSNSRRTVELDRYFVVLAFVYGVEVDRISELSGISGEGVRRILGGGS